MKNVFLVFAIALLMILPCVNTLAAEPNEIVFQIGEPKYWYGQDEIPIDENPAITPFIDVDTGKSLVPLRCLSEKLGFTVEWKNESCTAVISKENVIISIKIDSREIGVILESPDITYNSDGQISKPLLYSSNYESDVAPCIYNGRTFVPLRLVAELFGYDVHWEETTEMIIITKRDIQADVVCAPKISNVDGKYSFVVDIENKTQIPLFGVFNSSANLSVSIFDAQNNLIRVRNLETDAITYGYIEPNGVGGGRLEPENELILEPGKYTAVLTTGVYYFFDERIQQRDFNIEFEVTKDGNLQVIITTAQPSLVVKYNMNITAEGWIDQTPSVSPITEVSPARIGIIQIAVESPMLDEIRAELTFGIELDGNNYELNIGSQPSANELRYSIGGKKASGEKVTIIITERSSGISEKIEVDCPTSIVC